MKSFEFVEKLKSVATDCSTTYVMGGFGCRLGLDWYSTEYQWNKDHAAEIDKKKNTNPLTFGFDCVCLLKSILFWGFTGDEKKEYGGAKYDRATDITVNALAETCPDLTAENWDKIEPGEIVWMKGHIGAYVGDGLVVESTPAWKSGVQLTSLANIGKVQGYPSRKWEKHGHSSHIDYKSDWESAYAKLSEAFGKLEAERDEAEKKVKSLEIELKTQNTALSDAYEKLLAEQSKNANLAATSENDKAEIARLNSKIKSLEQELKDADEINEKQIANLQREIVHAESEHRKVCESYLAEINSLRKEIVECEKIIDGQPLKGDINGDGKVNLADVFELLFEVLGRKGEK